MQKCLFTLKSVIEEHSNKLCNHILDVALDTIFVRYPKGRECNKLTAPKPNDKIMIIGETITDSYVDIPEITNNAHLGFDASTYYVLKSIITNNNTVDTIDNDNQGIMIGYVCEDIPELVKMPDSFLASLNIMIKHIREYSQIDYLGLEGKTQVMVDYGYLPEILCMDQPIIHYIDSNMQNKKDKVKITYKSNWQINCMLAI